MMKHNNFLRVIFCLVMGIAVFSCNFPYQPKQFILPAIPSPFISPDSITAFIGTSNVKIAYTLNEDSRWIYYIDFNQPSSLPVKLKKPVGKEKVGGDSPLISPDGAFVVYYLTHGNDLQGAYMQRLDGAATPVLVADNGAEPHWWTDSTGQLYVLYSNQLMSVLSTTLVPGEYATYRQKVSLSGDGSLIGAPEKIAPYSMNGGISKNGRYLCTGYQNAAFYDLAGGVLIPINPGVQTCNPSIDPDTAHPDVMMFLNIGKVPQNLTNPFLGNADFPSPLINEHQMIFIVNSANTVVDYVSLGLLTAKYGAYQEWQDPEWSNNPRFAAALGVIDDATADGVIVKGIGDANTPKEILNITPGKFKLNPTSTPYVWIGK